MGCQIRRYLQISLLKEISDKSFKIEYERGGTYAIIVGLETSKFCKKHYEV